LGRLKTSHDKSRHLAEDQPVPAGRAAMRSFDH